MSTEERPLDVAGSPVAPPEESAERARQMWVYFVEAEGLPVVKIGRAADPDVRLRELQTGSPARLRIVAVVRETEKNSESAYHRRFSEYRQHGEWFTKGPRLTKFLERLGAGAKADMVRFVRAFEKVKWALCLECGDEHEVPAKPNSEIDPDFCSLECQRRFFADINSDRRPSTVKAGITTEPVPYGCLIGQFFHTWQEGHPHYQGIVRGFEDGSIIGELFSWMDGCLNGFKKIPMNTFITVYPTAEAMRAALLEHRVKCCGASRKWLMRSETMANGIRAAFQEEAE